MTKVKKMSVVIELPRDMKPGSIIEKDGKRFEVFSIQSFECMSERLLLLNCKVREVKKSGENSKS